MNSKIKTVIGILALAVFIGIAFFAYGFLSEEVGTPDILTVSPAAPTSGQTEASGAEDEDNRIIATDFTVLDAEGNEVKLSDFFGKPIVLNFWASWCPPCRLEMPEFNMVYEEMGADITFMMIDLVDGQRETMEKGAKYVLDQGFSFPVFYDTKGEAGFAYGISSIPTTIFIDKDGHIITGAQGAIDEETLRRGIDIISG